MDSDENLVFYRRFISSFANKLDASEANQIAYIRTGATKNSADGAFFLLLELERRNVFSFKNPSGLIDVAKDIGREDLVLSVKEYVEMPHPLPAQQPSKHVKKKPVPIPSEERQHLENVHDTFVSKCVDFESEFHKTWKQDTVTKEEGLQLLKRGQEIAQDLLLEMKIGQMKLKRLSRLSSGSSISSNDGSECSTSPENSLSAAGLSSSPTRHTPAKQRPGPNRDKPIPIPRKPKTPPPYKRAVQESTRYASPLLGAPLSARNDGTQSHDQPPPVPPKHSPRLAPKNSSNSEMCRLTLSVCMVSQMGADETATEESDQTGDSGMGTGSGATKYGTIEEWKESIQNPPPDTHEHRYQPINTHSTDAVGPYQELNYNN